MKKINFALVSDALFFTVCAFILSFTAVRFYLKSALTALIIALGCSVAVLIISLFALISRRKKRLIASVGESERKSLSLHLSVCSPYSVKQLFKNALDGTYIEDSQLQDDEHAYYFNFKLSPLSADDIAEIIRYDEPKRKCVYCCEIAPAALSLAEDFDIRVQTIGHIYALLKDKKLLPEKYAMGNVKKPNIFKRIKKRFNRKIAAPLFFCGLTMLFFSFFVTFPVYYTVIGGVLLLLSAISVLISQPS